MKKIIFIITSILILFISNVQLGNCATGQDNSANGSALFTAIKSSKSEVNVFNILLNIQLKEPQNIERVNIVIDGKSEVYYFGNVINYSQISTGKFSNKKASILVSIPEFNFEQSIDVEDNVVYDITVDNITKIDNNKGKTKLNLFTNDLDKELRKTEPYLFTFEDSNSKVFRTIIYKKDVIDNSIYINCSIDCPSKIKLLGTDYSYNNGEYSVDIESKEALENQIKFYTNALFIIIGVIIVSIISITTYFYYRKRKEIK